MYHKECDQEIFVDLSKGFKLLGKILPAKDNRAFQTVKIHLFKVNNYLDDLEFWCIQCNCKVKLNDLIIRCRHCGNAFKPDDIQIPADSGGFYCKDHIRRFEDERHFNLINLFSKALYIR